MRLFFYHLGEQLKNSPAKRDRLIISTTVLALLLNIATWAFLYWQLRNILATMDQLTDLPLHYNVLLGIDLYGPWWHALLMPLIGSVTILINTFLAIAFYTQKVLASYILSITTLLVQIAMAGAVLLMILINL